MLLSSSLVPFRHPLVASPRATNNTVHVLLFKCTIPGCIRDRERAREDRPGAKSALKIIDHHTQVSGHVARRFRPHFRPDGVHELDGFHVVVCVDELVLEAKLIEP